MEAPKQVNRDLYRNRWGDPSQWAGDWSRKGRYLRKGDQPDVQQRLSDFKGYIMGASVRRVPSQTIAAVLGVTRESVDRRLRPEGFKNAPGQVGTPRKATVDCAELLSFCPDHLHTQKVIFGNLIKAIVREEGKTLDMVAKTVGIPASQFSRYTAGKWSHILPGKLVAIIRAVTPDVGKQSDLMVAYLLDMTPAELRPNVDVGRRYDIFPKK